MKLADIKSLLDTREKQETALAYIKRREKECSFGDWFDDYAGIVRFAVEIASDQDVPDLKKGTANAVHAWLDRFSA